MVRVAYAENIATLAETALRFLEIAQLSHNTDRSTIDLTMSTIDVTSQYKHTSYDVELQVPYGIYFGLYFVSDLSLSHRSLCLAMLRI